MVVKQTGGWITARSQVGQGTVFDIYFPQVRAEAQVQVEVATMLAAPEPLSKIKTPAAAARGTETVLLVEDQDGIRDLVREFLEKKGYTVLHAGDGSEALQMTREYKNSIHLLLTDVVMPNVGGQELAKRLTQVRPHMKVLFMSGYPDHGTWSSELVDASAEVLQKPFPLDTLNRKIRSLLDE